MKRHDWFTPARKILEAFNPYQQHNSMQIRLLAKQLKQEDEIMREMSFKTTKT